MLTKIALPIRSLQFYYIHTMQNKITLTPNEIELFKIIKQVAFKYKPDMTLRIAGGWVRDKVAT